MVRRDEYGLVSNCACGIAWLSVKLDRVRADANALGNALDSLIDRVRELRDKMAAQSNP